MLIFDRYTWPIFFFPYGTSTGDDNSSNVILQMRILGYKATGIRPRFPNSITTTPLHPGSKIDAVECTTMPSLPRLDLPSSLPIRSSGNSIFSTVVARTKSPGCKINGSVFLKLLPASCRSLISDYWDL